MTSTEPLDGDDETALPQIDPTAHASLQLENALLRAGVDLESEQGKLVRSAWEGREPELESIKRQWELVKPGEAKAPETEPEPRIEGEDNQGQERRSLTASAVVEPNPMDKHPREVARAAALEVLEPKDGAVAGTRDDALATGVHHILEAAARGDERVLVGYEPVTE